MKAISLNKAASMVSGFESTRLISQTNLIELLCISLIGGLVAVTDRG
jgi:hypothetical protein